jgi:hypothetical protein
MEEMDVEKLILLVKNHNQFTTLRVVNTGTAPYFDNDVHNNKSNSTTNNSNNILIVIRPSI